MIPVSYTHLDVYKRQELTWLVSYVIKTAVAAIPATAVANVKRSFVINLVVRECACAHGHVKSIRSL